MTSAISSILTERFQTALGCAARWHAVQSRKGSGVPYLAHLLGVASNALEFGASEDEAIAALLHDALEDGPTNTGHSPQELRSEIAALFGAEVAALVDAATDAAPMPGQAKPAWAERKLTYLRHLPAVSASALLVSASDKLYNARTILVDYLTEGESVFERFSTGREGTLQYYRLLADQYLAAAKREDVAARPRLLALFRELERTVGVTERSCGVSSEEVRAYPLLTGRA